MIVGLFPGQGVDKRLLLEALPENHVRLREAHKLLGFDLRRAVETGGPRLATTIAQPAILTAGVIAFESALASGSHFDYLLGHSLGEYTALVAGGAISFPQGIRLVAARADAMRRAANRSVGGMAAFIGMPRDRIDGLASSHGLVVANDNSPTQIVLSGSEEGLAEAAREAVDADARVVRLQVEGAFHSPFMAPAVSALDEALAHVIVRQPVVPVLSNVTARPYRAPGEIRKMLLEQLTGTVHFRGAVEWLVGAGMTDHIDLGPGRVVGRLVQATTGDRAAAHA
jgi:[acyl-carrier-protein] S-malonyltransferase